MKSYLSKLNPAERRFVVIVAMVFFVVINIFWVWPHFSDWSAVKSRLATASSQLTTFNTAFQQTNVYGSQITKWQGEAGEVPPEDQAVQFLRTIQTQAAQSGVAVTGNGRLITRTNQFFLEQVQTITVQSGESQLVDFLYKLGAGNSLVRVRDLTLRPDPPRHQLQANITLIASYQKNPRARPAAAPAAAPTAPKAPVNTSKPVPPKPK
jgi:hypothetical protein